MGWWELKQNSPQNFQLFHLCIVLFYFQGGFAISYVLLFGNEMLLTSFFFSGLLTVTVSIYSFCSNISEIIFSHAHYWFFFGFAPDLNGISDIYQQVVHLSHFPGYWTSPGLFSANNCLWTKLSLEHVLHPGFVLTSVCRPQALPIEQGGCVKLISSLYKYIISHVIICLKLLAAWFQTDQYLRPVLVQFSLFWFYVFIWSTSHPCEDLCMPFFFSKILFTPVNHLMGLTGLPSSMCLTDKVVPEMRNLM